MIVVDIETTGLDGNKSSIVSIGAVSFEDSTKTFYEECKIWDGAIVLNEALLINGFTESDIKNETKKTEAEIVEDFINFLNSQKDYFLAGHNPILDINFLDFAIQRAGKNRVWGGRTLDLHSICYAHMVRRKIDLPTKDGKSTLTSDIVMDYVGIPREPRPHIGINGALWETEAFSRLLYNENKLEQFKEYPIPWLA